LISQWVTILGATGSIGQNTLDVIARHPDRYKVYALTAYQQIDALAQACITHNPVYAVIGQTALVKPLQQTLVDNGCQTQVLCGHEALEQVASAPEVDQVMAAIVGAAGLLPTLAAAKAGKRILLANKEALVMSGELFMNAVKHNNATLMPIDSEHNAIFQSLPHGFTASPLQKSQISKIVLTASGGPFRNASYEQLKAVTPAQAVKHPNWSMGQKISIDSATLMNKGLELIEACWLFDVTPKNIEVVIHPESVIHSMVQYVDGSVINQMGNPDMRTPIAYGLAWPERIHAGVAELDFSQVTQLNFEQPNHALFPALTLASDAFTAGGTAPAILNAANEVAVEAFLREQIDFLSISQLVDRSLQAIAVQPASDLEHILEADRLARQLTLENIGS